MIKKPNAAKSEETIAQVVGKRMSIEAEKLTCLTIQNDDLGEIWRIDGWDIPLIMLPWVFIELAHVPLALSLTGAVNE